MIRVLLTDRDQWVRDTLTARINTNPNMVVVATAATAVEALGHVVELQPDVVVVDPYLPNCDGSDLCDQIRAIQGDSACVVHATSLDGRVTTDASRGAAAIVLKSLQTNNLITTIEQIAKESN